MDVSILVNLLIFVLIIGVLFYVINIIPLPDPWKTVVTVIACLIVIIILLNMLLGGPMLRLR